MGGVTLNLNGIGDFGQMLETLTNGDKGDDGKVIDALKEAMKNLPPEMQKMLEELIKQLEEAGKGGGDKGGGGGGGGGKGGKADDANKGIEELLKMILQAYDA